MNFCPQSFITPRNNPVMSAIRRLSRAENGLMSPSLSISKGAHAHISLRRSVEMLALQCAQRFPARPADPDSSVFAELFSAPQLAPSQPRVPTAKAKARQMHLNWNPHGFLSEHSQQKSVTRCPPDVWEAFFYRSFGAPIPKRRKVRQHCG